MSKIVMIHPNAGVGWGNSEIFAVELARRLDNYLELELLSGADCGSFSRPIKSITRSNIHGIANHPLIACVLKKWFSRPEIAIEHLTSFFPCIAYLLKNPADLIFPQNDYGGLFVATCVRAIKGTPIMFTEHNSLANCGNCLKRNLALKPDRLILINPEAANQARNLAPNQVLNVIPYGVDPREFTPEGKAIVTGLPKPTVLCVAPLNRDRNQRIELTIEAVSRLPDASLLICGNGIDRDYFQDLGDRLLGRERFQIRAFAYAQMPQVYRGANVFTSASIQEPHGLTYIEAMASGLPVVATDDAVRRYLIGNGGTTCDVTNPDVYTQSLQNALEVHWDWQQQPRQNALRFSWQKITQLYYKAILQTIFNSNKTFSLSSNHSLKQ
ncbi:glycosyltransferase [Pleurocapsales cyanobacterium LEGE 10410]|nr:glycosyltransferase [Pleurocapsales cyanobacterium LEGE 10410]